MPPTPYNPHTNPSIYYAPKPPIGPKPAPANPWAVNTPFQPPKPGNYQAPGSYASGVEGGLMGNLPAPAYGNGGYPTATAPAGGGAPAPARIEGPYGNWFDPTDGPHGNWKDAWGNVIAHMNVTPGAGGPGAPNAGFPQVYPDPAATPAAPVPGVPAPVQGTPQTFYSPTTGSPYLQLGGNFLSYLDGPGRQQLDSVLRAAGFQSTGAMNTYGPSDYIRPPQFDQQDVNNLALSEPMRQWLRFFLGNLGYGQSYQLPAGYVPGSGLPTPPPMPMGTQVNPPTPAGWGH